VGESVSKRVLDPDLPRLGAGAPDPHVATDVDGEARVAAELRGGEIRRQALGRAAEVDPRSHRAADDPPICLQLERSPR
jgi:hypothetical protein